MTEADVVAAEELRCTATVAQDVATLGRLLADDLVWIHSSSAVEDKSAFLARIETGSDRYLAIRRSEQSIRFRGPVAIVTGVADMDAMVAGTPRAVRNRFTNIWHSEDGILRLVSCQSTKVA
jgi:ketosteroid isomerase-like protein